MVEAGLDLVDIGRVQRIMEQYGHRFARRVFTEQEWRDCHGNAASAAARFAAKEATIKALGDTGVGLRDVEVVKRPSGQPRIRLSGKALERAREMGVRSIAVSLTHTHEYAAAMVVVQLSD